jgi:RHS repeat-associated protein
VIEVHKTPDPGSEYVYKHFVWDLRYIDAPVFRVRYDSNEDVLDKLYYCNDANMNVTCLVDADDGDVEERYHYDPYGKVTFLYEDFTELATQASQFDNCVLFAGYIYDKATGLYSVRRRPYHPTVGRWLVHDIWYLDGLNLYEYARSWPTGAVDPHGMFIIQAIEIAAAFSILDASDWENIKNFPENIWRTHVDKVRIQYDLAHNLSDDRQTQATLVAEYMHRVVQFMIHWAPYAGMELSTELLKHWREGTGETVTFEAAGVEEILKNQDVQKKLGPMVLDSVARETSTWLEEAAWNGVFAPAGSDLHYALGGFYINFTGSVCHEVENNLDILEMEGNFSISDDYTFVPGERRTVMGQKLWAEWFLTLEQAQYQNHPLAQPFHIDSEQWEGDVRMEIHPQVEEEVAHETVQIENE